MFQKHIINCNEKTRVGIERLNNLQDSLVIFVVDNFKRVIGTISDGDIRRGIVRGFSLEDKIEKFTNKSFHFIIDSNNNYESIKKIREKGINLIPILDNEKRILDIIFLNKNLKNIIPVSAVIMAGGEGRRLMPLTKDCPKPLLKIKDKFVIEYVFDLLKLYGIDDINVCLNHKHEKFLKFFERYYEGKIKYVIEDKKLGTIGGIKLFKDFKHEDIFLINADVVTDINLENFYSFFKKHNSSLSVATQNFSHKIPYAVIEEKNNIIFSLKEKPELNYNINTGIYLFKKKLIENIPKNQSFDATDFILKLIYLKESVNAFNFYARWVDIGSPKQLKQLQDEK